MTWYTWYVYNRWICIYIVKGHVVWSLITAEMKIVHVPYFSANLKSVAVLEFQCVYYIYTYIIYITCVIITFPNTCWTVLFCLVCTIWKQPLDSISSWLRIHCLWKMPDWYPGNWNLVWMWGSNNVSSQILLSQCTLVWSAGIKLFSKIIEFLFSAIVSESVDIQRVFLRIKYILSLFRKFNCQVTFLFLYFFSLFRLELIT